MNSATSARVLTCADLGHEPLATLLARYGLTVEDILGDGTKRRFAWPRQEAMYLLRTKFELSYPRIGKIFGRDHSTVMSGCRHYMMRAGVPARLATGWDEGREGGK